MKFNPFTGTFDFDSGQSGADGREIEMRASQTHLQWRYAGEGEEAWVDLLSLDLIAGQDGRNLELRSNATHIQWRPAGTEVWTDLCPLALVSWTSYVSLDNASVELRATDTHIQWRTQAGQYFQGEPIPSSWIDLVPLQSLSGANGKTILNGTGAPAAGLGTIGDFYLDTASWLIYGPKASGGWGVGASLVGPAGALPRRGVPAGVLITSPGLGGLSAQTITVNQARYGPAIFLDGTYSPQQIIARTSSSHTGTSVFQVGLYALNPSTFGPAGALFTSGQITASAANTNYGVAFSGQTFSGWVVPVFLLQSATGVASFMGASGVNAGLPYFSAFNTGGSTLPAWQEAVASLPASANAGLTPTSFVGVSLLF